jgi:hypothetical protein
MRRSKDLVSPIFKRAETEVRMWDARMKDMSDVEISDLVGLSVGVVRSSLASMLRRISSEGNLIARSWAVRETVLLFQDIYSPAEVLWRESGDPRYAELMRGALSDIRKIWGVDAPQRVQTLSVHVGVMDSELGRLSVDELRMLRGMFPGDSGGCDGGVDPSGSGLPELPGLLSVSNP